MRLEGQAKAGYYPTPPRVVDYIATYIAAYGGIRVVNCSSATPVPAHGSSARIPPYAAM